MTQIHGKIESLKRIRETLDQKCITRFNTIGEIKDFLKNYDNEKEELFFNKEREFDIELDVLQNKAFYLQKHYEELRKKTETSLNIKINEIKARCSNLSKPAKNAVFELLNWYQQQILMAYKFILKKNDRSIIFIKTYPSKKRLESTLNKVKEYNLKRHEIISARCAPSFSELEHTKKAATDLHTLIAGAIGEHMVSKELEKLNDSFILINDFNISFEKPIFNRKNRTLIHSVQIDHLLVTYAGIFIIETKNWSKKSISQLDLKSPVKQIERANYALYILLNNAQNTENGLVKKHHWGVKKIPLRNIVAMIHHKPKDKFQYVAIKQLNELNGYINHFEPLFDSSEVQNIADYLLKISNE